MTGPWARRCCGQLREGLGAEFTAEVAEAWATIDAASGNHEVSGVCARGSSRIVGRGSRGASPAANGVGKILVRRRMTGYDGGL